jgi:hypothetical protein
MHCGGANQPNFAFPVVWRGELERGKECFMSKIFSKFILAASISLAMALTFSQQEASLC